MTKKKTIKEHGGACPTCGHCKCCEKKEAVPVPTIFPICTRPHYPLWDWTYRSTPIWYGTSGGTTTTGNLTITSGEGNA